MSASVPSLRAAILVGILGGPVAAGLSLWLGLPYWQTLVVYVVGGLMVESKWTWTVAQRLREAQR